MSDKKKFLLRLDDRLFAALEKWAADDLRSINAQIEYLLTEATRKAGRKIEGKQIGGHDTDFLSSPNPR
jgi:hypothetical protein